MDADKNLEKKINLYREVAKENPAVDVNLLMLNALQTQRQNSVSAKSKRWAYLISIGVPPFGFFFALKYFAFSDKDDASNVAWTCVVLTIISVALFLVVGKVFFTSSGTSMQQIEQIKPSDIQQVLQ